MDYRKTIEQYYRAYKEADKKTLRSILIDDFLHISSFRSFTNRDEIAEIEVFMGREWDK